MFRVSGGYAAITATMVVLVLSLTLLTSFSFFALNEVQGSRLFRNAVEARAADNGALEDAVYRVVTGKQIAQSETLAIATSTVTLTVTTTGNQRIIRATGTRGNAAQSLEVKVILSTSDASFFYGAQAGDDGVEMEQSSTIVGSIYSNGPIIGENGSLVTGDAFAAGTSRITNLIINGNAQASLIEDSTVGGYASSTAKLDDVIVGKDAHTGDLVDTTVNRDAYYQTIDRRSVVLGARNPATPPPDSLEPLAFPIPDATIATWKQDAVKMGTIAAGTCSEDWSPPTSPYTVTGGVLEKNLKLDNKKVLILKGTVWVKCAIDVDGGASITLDPAYGDTSGVLIADGWMHLQNNGEFRGSGTAGSYLMLLSAAVGGGHHGSAIDLHNKAAGAIFYAPNGLIFLHQNVEVTELVGKKLHLENNAELTYELGLQNMQFSAGPSGGYDVKYWKRTE